jgi:hypothetical protein
MMDKAELIAEAKYPMPYEDFILTVNDVDIVDKYADIINAIVELIADSGVNFDELRIVAVKIKRDLRQLHGYAFPVLGDGDMVG